jgi:hypothetical protein
MTPQEQQALQLLDNVTSQIALPRADHARIVEALNTVTAGLQQAPVQQQTKEK